MQKTENGNDGDITNSHGIALKDLSDQFNLTQLGNEPSHLNNVGKPT